MSAGDRRPAPVVAPRAAAALARAAPALLLWACVALPGACGAPPGGSDGPAMKPRLALLAGVDTAPSRAAIEALDAAARHELRECLADERRPLHERARALRLWSASAPLTASSTRGEGPDEVDPALQSILDDEQAPPELRVQAAWARVRRAGVGAIDVARGLLASTSPDLRAVGVLALWEDCSGAARALVAAHAAAEADADTATIARVRLARWPGAPGCGR
jgi:hypothetical protein